MYKVKENTFRIKDFTSGDKVDESKFIETTNQRNKKTQKGFFNPYKNLPVHFLSKFCFVCYIFPGRSMLT